MFYMYENKTAGYIHLLKIEKALHYMIQKLFPKL